jgi:cell division protein FtsB
MQIANRRKENKNTQKQSLDLSIMLASIYISYNAWILSTKNQKARETKATNDDLSKTLKAFKSNVSLAMRENGSR